jgi:hypothetical protein
MYAMRNHGNGRLDRRSRERGKRGSQRMMQVLKCEGAVRNSEW